MAPCGCRRPYLAKVPGASSQVPYIGHPIKFSLSRIPIPTSTGGGLMARSNQPLLVASIDTPLSKTHDLYTKTRPNAKLMT